MELFWFCVYALRAISRLSSNRIVACAATNSVEKHQFSFINEMPSDDDDDSDDDDNDDDNDHDDDADDGVLLNSYCMELN